MDLNYKYSIKRWFFNYPIPTFLPGWDLVQQRLRPMRVSVGFDGQDAALTFLSPDRKVDAGQCAWNPTESRFIRSLCCTKSHPDKNVGIG